MTAVESSTQSIGRELFDRVRGATAIRTPSAFAEEMMMSLAMRDEAVKAQLFRFVDVLPTLRSPREINAHLREYLGQVSDHLPASMASVVRRLPDGCVIARAIAWLARFSADRMARRFIAATDLDEAVTAVLHLRRQTLGSTIDLLGETVLSEAEADIYQRQYLDLIDGLSDRLASAPMVDQIDRSPLGMQPRVNVSVKLSSLFSQFDPIDPSGASVAVLNRLRPILRLARQRGAFIYFDMEQSAYKNLTLQIFKQAFDDDEFRDWPDVGIVIQAYLIDSANDLDALATWTKQRQTPITVRLVKGAYWDYETIIAEQNHWEAPVFLEKSQTDANFETLTEFLIEHRQTLHPAIATHNIRSIAHALSLIQKHRVPARTVEFQMLYGMADPIKAALVDRGERVRVYTPFGKLLPGMAYLVRRLLENTSNESFLRAGFLEHLPEEQLLMNPLTLSMRRQTIPSDGDGNGRPAPPCQAVEFHNEPVSDFSRADTRNRMKLAIDRASFSPPHYIPGKEGSKGSDDISSQRPAPALSGSRSDMEGKNDAQHPLIINGEAIHTDQSIYSINPSHSARIVGRCARATPEHARQAIAAANAAFTRWRDESAENRAALLDRVAGVLRRSRFDLAAIEVLECGKPWREADADVAEAIDFCVYYACEARRLAKPRRWDIAGETNVHFYEPRGVAVVIAPWNFPLAILCGMTAAAVVTGNTVVMKPAEQSPIIAAMLMQAFAQAEAPAGVVNYLPGIGEEIGPVLVEHPDVALIAFTGSRAVGLAINESAARIPSGQDHIKRVIAEMGGKNAIVIDRDADLDEAIHGVVASAFGYSGQKCSACSRVIVMEEIYDPFVARLIDAVQSIRVGPADEPDCLVGPVIDAEARDRILSAIQRGKSEAPLAYAGDMGALQGEGYYVAPHIFKDVPPDSSLAQQEIFGPVLAAMKARDLGHAIALANGTPYALTGGIYSRSPANILRMGREFRVGNLYVNRKTTGAAVGRQPFGGFKMSGVGSKAGGMDYLLQFVLPRVITENTLRRGFAPTEQENRSGI